MHLKIKPNPLTPTLHGAGTYSEHYAEDGSEKPARRGPRAELSQACVDNVSPIHPRHRAYIYGYMYVGVSSLNLSRGPHNQVSP